MSSYFVPFFSLFLSFFFSKNVVAPVCLFVFFVIWFVNGINVIEHKKIRV